MTFLNTPYPPVIGVGWRPRVRLTVGGVTIANVLEVEVVSSNYFQADRIDISVVLLPNDPNNQTLQWWCDQPQPLIVDVYLGALPPGTPSLTPSGGQPPLQNDTFIFRGQVDRLSWSATNNVLTITGRDLSSLLLDTKTEMSYQNQTSSQIATMIAAEHSLTPVITATTTKIGRYYQEQHTKLVQGEFIRATNEWDLLVYLARQEGFNLWVSKSELHFEPPKNYDNLPMYLVEYVDGQNKQPNQLNVMDMTLDWSLTLAKDIRVEIKSWNSEKESSFIRSYGKTVGTSTGSKVQIYSEVRPNLTADGALQLAQQVYRELTAHERTMNFKIPGELQLTPRHKVQLIGTNSGPKGFDQVYFIDEIRRNISFEGGFVQYIRVKNHSPQSEVNVG